MPRLPRICVEGAISLVTSRGSLEDPLFKDPHDYQAYRHLIAEYRRRHGVKLFAYCLLPDHVHLCVETDPSSLSAFMHDLTVAYTKAFNKRHGRSGHLFQQRFKTVIVEKGTRLLPVTAYLHAHPIRSGIAADAAGHPFTSYARYCAPDEGSDGLDMGMEVREALVQPPAPASYEAYVIGFSPAEITQLRDALRQRIVGSEDFVARVKSALSHYRDEPPAAPAEAAPARMRPRLLLAGNLAVAAALALMVASLSHKIGRLEGVMRVFALAREAVLRTQLASFIQPARPMTLEGTVWEMRIIPVDGVAPAATKADRLMFTRQRMTSDALAMQGFPTATIKTNRQPDGTIVWETAQSNANGVVVTWQGAWSGGTTMRGSVSRQTPGQAPARFTFVGVVRDGQTT